MQPVLCFDWDGVLADSMALCIAETRQTLLEMGLPDLPDDVLISCNGPTYEQAAPILHIPPERLEEYMQIRHTIGLRLAPVVNRLFPGIREMLETLHDKAMLCIVSNGHHDYVTLCLREFHLAHLFTHVVTARLGRTKTQNLQELLDQLQPEQAVMIGDRLTDFQAGQACGLPTVAACYGCGCPEEYAQATVQVQTVAQLQDVLLAFADGRELTNP